MVINISPILVYLTRDSNQAPNNNQTTSIRIKGKLMDVYSTLVKTKTSPNVTSSFQKWKIDTIQVCSIRNNKVELCLIPTQSYN